MADGLNILDNLNLQREQAAREAAAGPTPQTDPEVLDPPWPFPARPFDVSIAAPFENLTGEEE